MEPTPETMQRFIDQGAGTPERLCSLCDCPHPGPGRAHRSCLDWVSSAACREQCAAEGIAEVPRELVDAMYAELYAGIPLDLPTAEEVEDMAKAAGLDGDPFKGS